MRGNNYAIYPHESKFTENINTDIFAQKMQREGLDLRKKLLGHRILPDLSSREHYELMNSYRL